MTTKHIRYDEARYKLVASSIPVNVSQENISKTFGWSISFFDKVQGSMNLPNMLSIVQIVITEYDESVFKLYQRQPDDYMTELCPLMKDWYLGDIMEGSIRKGSILVHWERRKNISVLFVPKWFPNHEGHEIIQFIRHWMGNPSNKKGPGGDPARNTFDSSVKDGNK
jgi:hypothetical protein